MEVVCLLLPHFSEEKELILLKQLRRERTDVNCGKPLYSLSKTFPRLLLERERPDRKNENIQIQTCRRKWCQVWNAMNLICFLLFLSHTGCGNEV